ncbi:MAG TPA: sulfotransferase [Gaiellaceae bacterium]|nr:sulfotransferase [Gaiellaceae bacterium]
MSQRPILVTGAHRSGTTWVGKMLALAPGVGYVHEPFNPDTPKGLSSAPFDHYFTVVTAENEARYLPGLERTLAYGYDWSAELRSMHSPRDAARAVRDATRFFRARRAGARPLVKDPIALLSAEWLAERFGMDVVVLVRHPAGFAGSLKRLGWKHSFATFLVDGCVPEILRPYEDEIRAQAESPGGALEQAALLWRILYGAVVGYRERHPDWVFLRHEDAGSDPVGTYERLYARLGLELTPAARERIERASRSENPVEADSPHAVDLDSAGAVSRWRTILEPDEVDFLRERTQDVWPRFYSDEDW